MLFAAVEELLCGIEKQVDSSLLETPQDRHMADVALPCFRLAKERGQAPHEIAASIATQLTPNKKIAKIEATGPYVNFFAHPGRLAGEILPHIAEKKERYGYAPARNEKILLEGRQPNTHKIFHVGHLRNALVSEAIATISEAAGYDVTRCSYLGDIGAHVAKWIRYYTRFDNSSVPTQRVSVRAGEIYVEAGKKIEENPEVYKAEVHATQHALESGDEKLVTLWKETAQKCLDDIHAINNELGSTQIVREYLESEVEQPGIQMVHDLVEQDVKEIRHSEGAIICDLQEHDLGVFVILKSNGTSLYSTKDIALAYLKQQEYTFDKSLYIVATEQIHHFNQLFKTLELLGYTGAEKLEHISYGMVELASGKMSSRDGNIITYYDLRDRMLSQAEAIVSARDFAVEKKKAIASDVAFAAMKFDMLLQDAFKRIVFDMEKALSFEGETGPYIQYTHARCVRIVERHTGATSEIEYALLENEYERMLLVLLQEFPGVILKAAETYKPNLVARYVLDLARLFNKYYQHVKIVQDDPVLQAARMDLVIGVRQVLDTGLGLLGIAAPDAM